MNIFYLHESPKIAAAFHCDKHVIKMILESAQLLSTAHRVLDGKVSEEPKKGPHRKYIHPLPGHEAVLYSATHINHPCAVWVRESKANYEWLFELMMELNAEFVRRYNKREDHLTVRKLKRILQSPPESIPDIDFTNPPSCMPEQYVTHDPVLSYRNYYNGDKADIAKWTATPKPTWFQPN